MRSWITQASTKVRSANYWLGAWTAREKIIRGRQAAAERRNTQLFVLAMLNRAKPNLPLKITMTRIAPRRFDADNLGPQGAFKHVQDGIADALKVDDGDKRIEWVCAQERGRPKEYGVRIEIEEVL